MTRTSPSLLAAAMLATACGGGSAAPARRPAPAPQPAANAAPAPISLATGYRATALMERSDSIILTLPTGDKQVQRMGRHARFTIDVRRDGAVRVRLDSLALKPSTGGREHDAVGTVWQGQLTAGGLGTLRTSASNPLVADLGERVRDFFPTIPGDGVLPGVHWADTSDATRHVEIFEAQEHRVRQWEAVARGTRLGVVVQPVRLTEHYEQLGAGQQAGREMRMSAQGSGTTTYYLLITGLIDAVVQTDSASRLITIPSTRQVVPTVQVTRTTVMFEYR